MRPPFSRAASQMVMLMIVDAVLESNPEFSEVLVPKCIAHNGCNEFRTCGYYARATRAKEVAH